MAESEDANSNGKHCAFRRYFTQEMFASDTTYLQLFSVPLFQTTNVNLHFYPAQKICVYLLKLSCHEIASIFVKSGIVIFTLLPQEWR